MVPALRGNNPAKQLRAVDFPQPDGPNSATNSPFWTVRERLESATDLPKARVTPSKRSSEKLVFDKGKYLSTGI